MRYTLLTPIIVLLPAMMCMAGDPPQSPDNPPDILALPADLENPAIATGDPAPGKMVLQSLPAYAGTEVTHALYLPADWSPKKRFPVIIEFLGNGSRVRDSRGIGYAISGGKGFIWAVLPYVSLDHKQDMSWWWGNVNATVAYTKEAVPAICRQWQGDPSQVILAGYSRGAIACNYIGLHDDEIAKLWKGMVAASHYDDGHCAWGMTPDEQRRAPERLGRLGKIPQFICGEHCSRIKGANDKKLVEWVAQKHLTNFAAAVKELDLLPIVDAENTRNFIARNHPQGNITIVDLPWVNHGSQVLLRDTPQRQRLREWVRDVLHEAKRQPSP